ncbi:MAG: hypothetical protein QOH47_835 [Sphingomonadales bacterium]|nr:hypothetical protein [Sphingomonadales bacterium]
MGVEIGAKLVTTNAGHRFDPQNVLGLKRLTQPQPIGDYRLRSADEPAERRLPADNADGAGQWRRECC